MGIIEPPMGIIDPPMARQICPVIEPPMEKPTPVAINLPGQLGDSNPPDPP